MTETIRHDQSSSMVSIVEIRSWASQLASESRGLDRVLDWYVWPDALRGILQRLEVMDGGIIGLVGVQGVGKSSALLAIWIVKMFREHDSFRKASKKKNLSPQHEHSIVRFKWRRSTELFRSLLDGTHELSGDFRRRYGPRPLESLGPRVQVDPEVKEHPERFSLDPIEKKLGRATARTLRQTVWLEMLRSRRTILIDTPDYSKTDRRMMAKDLDEMYWTWGTFSKMLTSPDDKVKSTLVIAVQKEMFQRHYFFDKMEKIELQPLRPEQMLEARAS